MLGLRSYPTPNYHISAIDDILLKYHQCIPIEIGKAGLCIAFISRNISEHEGDTSSNCYVYPRFKNIIVSVIFQIPELVLKYNWNFYALSINVRIDHKIFVIILQIDRCANKFMDGNEVPSHIWLSKSGQWSAISFSMAARERSTRTYILISNGFPVPNGSDLKIFHLLFPPRFSRMEISPSEWAAASGGSS